MIRAAIFDLDGLLVDSEPFWREAEIAVLVPLGVPLTDAACLETQGLRIDEVVTYWRGRHPFRDVAETDAVVAARIVDGVLALVRAKGEPLPGALEAVTRLRDACEKIAVASSSPMRLIEATLDAFGIRSRFDAIRSAEHEPLGKPHPGVYLRTADDLGIPATACLALEDSIHGVLAAKSARMRCIAVPEPARFGDPRYAIADAVVPSLAGIPDDRWTAWLKNP